MKKCYIRKCWKRRFKRAYAVMQLIYKHYHPLCNTYTLVCHLIHPSQCKSRSLWSEHIHSPFSFWKAQIIYYTKSLYKNSRKPYRERADGIQKATLDLKLQLRVVLFKKPPTCEKSRTMPQGYIYAVDLSMPIRFSLVRNLYITSSTHTDTPTLSAPDTAAAAPTHRIHTTMSAGENMRLNSRSPRRGRDSRKYI